MPAITTPVVVYVSNADSREIHVLHMDLVTGALTPFEQVAVAGTVMPLAVSPDRRFLYAALRSEPFSLASFAIDPASGRLTHLSTVPIVASMPSIATDRTGRFLLSASYQSSLVAVYPIGPGGFVQAQASQIIPTRPKAHQIATDPSNRFVYVPNLGGDIIAIFRFDQATGTLTPNQPPAIHTKPGAGPRHLVFHPNNLFLFLLNELDGSLNAYAFDRATGALAEIQSVSALPPGFAGKPSAADLHITPDGRFLYGSVRGSNTIAAFKVDGDAGRLTLIGSFATETEPRGFAIDPRGRFLLAAGQKSHAMTVYKIDPESGRLEAMKQYPMGKAPNWIEIVSLP
ncbi:MAG: lactonase family protein [Proteobacteria bacterium]|nr:lactonase family protein [Pseudomonadota bacterium]